MKNLLFALLLLPILSFAQKRPIYKKNSYDLHIWQEGRDMITLKVQNTTQETVTIEGHYITPDGQKMAFGGDYTPIILKPKGQAGDTYSANFAKDDFTTIVYFRIVSNYYSQWFGTRRPFSPYKEYCIN